MEYRSFGSASKIAGPVAQTRARWLGRIHLDPSRSSMPKHPNIRVLRHHSFEDLDMLQIRDIDVIASIARYHTPTRAQIIRLHSPTDHDGRITRKRLRNIH